MIRSSLEGLSRTSAALSDDLLLPPETVEIRAEAREFALQYLQQLDPTPLAYDVRVVGRVDGLGGDPGDGLLYLNGEAATDHEDEASLTVDQPGGMITISITDDYTAEVSAATPTLTSDFKAITDDEHKQVIDSSTIHAFVIGGAAGEATGIISGFDGLMQYIQSGGDFSADSPGAPIAYKVAYLDHAVTKLACTTEYSERECVKNQGPLRVRIVALDHLAGTDAGGNMEFYGAISVRHPTVAGDVISCAEGGAEADVWRLDEGSWLSFPELTRWEPESPTFVDLSEVPVGQGRLLCLKARLMEEDSSTGELSGDDDFGSAELLIPAEIGWPGEHVLHLQGSGENRIDVILEVSQP